MPFNSVTISLLSPAVRLGRDAGEVRQALFVSYRDVCHAYQANVCFHFPLFCMGGINNTGGIRRHFTCIPKLPHLATRTAPIPAKTLTRTSSLSLQGTCDMRTRPYQTPVIEHSSLLKFSNPLADLTSAANAHRRLSSYQVFVPTEDPSKDHFVPGNTVARPSPEAMQNSSLTGGPALLTKRNMPSCSNLPNIWTSDMDRFIVEIVILSDVEPQPLVKALKNRFPELTYVSTQLPSCHQFYLLS